MAAKPSGAAWYSGPVTRCGPLPSRPSSTPGGAAERRASPAGSAGAAASRPWAGRWCRRCRASCRRRARRAGRASSTGCAASASSSGPATTTDTSWSAAAAAARATVSCSGSVKRIVDAAVVEDVGDLAGGEVPVDGGDPRCRRAATATRRSIELDPVADQHGHVAPDRHAAVVEHPVAEPEGPIEELAAGAAAGEVVDGRGVGIGGDQVREAHAEPILAGIGSRRGDAVTCGHGRRRARVQGGHRRARWPTSASPIAKFIGFVITGSASMLAEAIHSVADSGNQGLLLLGRPPRPAAGRRGRTRSATAASATSGPSSWRWCCSASAGRSPCSRASRRSGTPTRSSRPGVAIGILLVAIALETFSFRTAIVESNKVRGDASWWQFIRRSKNPELPVVLLEDLGAEIGLVHRAGRRLRVARHRRPDLRRHRHAADRRSCSPSSPIILAVEMKSLLMGETADPKVQEAIRAGIEAEPEVDRLIHLRTQHLGPDELLIGAKVAFVDGLSVSELAGGGEPGRGQRAARRARGPRHVHRTRRGRHRPAGRPPRPPGSLRTGARGGRVTGADASGRRQLEALGELIRKQRQQAELTLRDLAERANVSNPYLSQIERGCTSRRSASSRPSPAPSTSAPSSCSCRPGCSTARAADRPPRASRTPCRPTLASATTSAPR